MNEVLIFLILLSLFYISDKLGRILRELQVIRVHGLTVRLEEPWTEKDWRRHIRISDELFAKKAKADIEKEEIK